MAESLNGKRIAFLATKGVEQVELEEPRKAVEGAGAATDLVSLEAGEIQAHQHLEAGDTFPVDKVASEVSASDYDGLVLPGGLANPDFLRQDEDAVRFVREFVESGKPVGVICHGPWTLAEADVLEGRRIASWPSIHTDLRRAGAEIVDEEVVVDAGLVTSRSPDDLEAFCSKIVEEFAEGEHEVHPEGATAEAAS